jgi:hypothetical protein
MPGHASVDRPFDSVRRLLAAGREEVRAVLAAGADLIHFDVMDNHYVPNLTIGPLVLASLRRAGIDCIMDVHLMVKPVDRLIGDFLEAGADIISVHPGSHRAPAPHPHGDPRWRRQPGLVFNPATPLDVLDEVIDLVDLVLVMSVNPGFGGQAIHRVQPAQAGTRPGLIDARAAKYVWRSTAASRPTTSAAPPMPAPTPSSPAPPFSAAATTPPPSAPCARRCLAPA